MVILATMSLMMLLISTAAFPQAQSHPNPPVSAPANGATQPNATAPERPASPIPWQPGPMTANLGGVAELHVPEGFLFADKAGTVKLLELTHNLVGGNEVGAIVPAGESKEDSWFVVFEFSDVGYVKDDEKNKIDAPALLKSIKEGTDEANKERKKRGWHTFNVDGWQRPPFYDTNTNNLTWAIRGIGDTGDTSVNHSVRVLGRRGTMNVDLVLDPTFYASTVPRFDGVMRGFRFKQGSRYADFSKGDKVAAYGLTALIAGGAGAVALKTGLLAKFWKALIGLVLVLKKAIVVLVMAVAAFFKRIWNKLTGRSGETVTAEASRDDGSPPSAGA